MIRPITSEISVISVNRIYYLNKGFIIKIMINITEISPPLKISGLSSILVQFDFNQYIVDSLKTIPTFYYHKKTHAWEFPVCYLGRLLDSLTFLDDIKLDLLNDLKSANLNNDLLPLTEAEKLSFKVTPFQHQLDAVNFGLEHKNWLLLDSMGSGKTNSIIWLAETLKSRGLIEHCLVICGVNSLKQNWKREIEKFSNYSAVVLGEYITRTGSIRYRSIEQRAQQLLEPIEDFFIITNLESLRDNRIIDAIKKSPNKFGLIALDEAHKCLTGDTVVQTDNGEISLFELSRLDSLPKVLSYNKRTGKNELRQIISITKSTPEEALLELILDDGGIQKHLKCTASHKIFTMNRGWVCAKDLTEKDDIKVS